MHNKTHKNMNTQSIDTHSSSEQVFISLLREKSIAQKFSQIRSLSQSTMQLSKRAIARANKGMSDQKINIFFIDLHYGKELALKVKTYIENRHDNS